MAKTDQFVFMKCDNVSCQNYGVARMIFVNKKGKPLDKKADNCLACKSDLVVVPNEEVTL